MSALGFNTIIEKIQHNFRRKYISPNCKVLGIELESKDGKNFFFSA